MNFSVGGQDIGILGFFIIFSVAMILFVSVVTALRWWVSGGKDTPADAAADRDEDTYLM